MMCTETYFYALTLDESHALTLDDPYAVTLDDPYAVTLDESNALTLDESRISKHPIPRSSGIFLSTSAASSSCWV